MPTTSPPDLDTARGLIESALGDLLAVGDDGLEAPWTWPDHGELDRRSGFFRIIEDLDAVTAGITARGVARPVDQAIVAPATVARWELIGLLAPLSEGDLDADPGGGEWTVRQTVAHIIASQHSYGVYTAWWRDQAIGTGDERLPFAARRPRRSRVGAGRGGRIARPDPEPTARRARGGGRAAGRSLDRRPGARRPLVRPPGHDRDPPGSLGVAHQRAHCPGRQDAGVAGPAAIRSRAPRPARGGRLGQAGGQCLAAIPGPRHARSDP